MAAGNNALYVTSQGCSVSGLSIGCPVTAADGWYYDGNTGYSYYISGGSVTAIEQAPCSTPPPPAPTPSVNWTLVNLAVGTSGAGGSACTRAQQGRTGVYYMNGSTFGTSTAIATSADGSGTPTNTTYSDGTIYRTVTNGGIGSGGNCNTQ